MDQEISKALIWTISLLFQKWYHTANITKDPFTRPILQCVLPIYASARSQMQFESKIVSINGSWKLKNGQILNKKTVKKNNFQK